MHFWLSFINFPRSAQDKLTSDGLLQTYQIIIECMENGNCIKRDKPSFKITLDTGFSQWVPDNRLCLQATLWAAMVML